MNFAHKSPDARKSEWPHKAKQNLWAPCRIGLGGLGLGTVTEQALESKANQRQ